MCQIFIKDLADFPAHERRLGGLAARRPRAAARHRAGAAGQARMAGGDGGHGGAVSSDAAPARTGRRWSSLAGCAAVAVSRPSLVGRRHADAWAPGRRAGAPGDIHMLAPRPAPSARWRGWLVEHQVPFPECLIERDPPAAPNSPPRRSGHAGDRGARPAATGFQRRSADAGAAAHAFGERLTAPRWRSLARRERSPRIRVIWPPWAQLRKRSTTWVSPELVSVR